jgi:hypothetical protein
MKCPVCGETMKREYDMFHVRKFVCRKDSKHTQDKVPKNPLFGIGVK